MLLLDIVHRSSRSLLSAKTRTLLTAFAIAVGAFALTLTLGASNGAHTYANSLIQDNFDPSELIVSKDTGLFGAADDSKPQVYDSSFGSVISASGATRQVKMLDDSDVSRLQKLPGVAAVRPAVTQSLQYITRDGQKKYAASALTYDSYKNPTLLAGAIPAKLASNSLILPEGFVSALGFSSPADAIGKTVRLSVRKQVDQTSILSTLLQGKSTDLNALAGGSGQSEEVKVNVIAVSKAPSMLIQPGTALYLSVDSGTLATLSNFVNQGTTSYHKYLSAYVKVAHGTDTATLNSVQANIKKLGYGAQSILDTEKTITQVITVLQGIVTVFGLIAIVASVFGVVNTMYISVLQRTREIGLMKALGMHKKDINRLFLFEAALIGLLGGALGTAGAVLAGLALNPTISNKLNIGSTDLLQFKAMQLALLIVALMVIAILAGLFPARKAAKLDPIEALRTE